MSKAKISTEIKELLGLIPTMFKEMPDSSLELEWPLFKHVQFDKGAIPNKYRELIGLAVSAVIKCKFCIYYHTELAKLNGATKAEIEDALRFAKSSVGWSTYISGLQIDFNTFKKEIDTACNHVRKMQKGKKKNLEKGRKKK